MGKHQRRKIGERNRLIKRLKFPIACVSQVMPIDFSNDDFLSLFKSSYPGLWNEINDAYISDKEEYKNRIAKGLNCVKPIRPLELIFSIAKSSLAKVRAYNLKSTNEQEQKKAEERLRMISRGNNKSHKINQRESERARKIQKVVPKYIHEFIKEYFNSRKKDNLDIDSRYLIIRECAKFKCRKTILFLQKINACEKNEELQLMAYNYLCRFGLHPRLRKKRKGKKRRTSTAKHQLEENPSTLLKLIFENQQILHKHFDVFLSHSYGRQLELLQAKDTLNSQGLVVYVDWINDAEMLEREKQNDDTFKVLYERLKQSSSLLFIQTKLSVASKYCMDEIEYFRQLRRPIYLLEVDTINDNSALFDGMIKVKLNQGKYMTEDGKDISDHLLEHNQRYGFS